MVYSGGVRSVVQAAALCALALSVLPSVQAKNVVSKQCIASDGDKSYGVYAIKDESCAKNGGLGCFGKVCRFCKVLDTPKSSHLNTCLSYGVAFTSTTPVVVTQGLCEVSSGDVTAGISAVTDSGCLNGGLGCFNDHCRYCKVAETPQSAGFMACSSLDSSYSAPVTVPLAPATAAPIIPDTVAPVTEAPTTQAPIAVEPVTEAPTIILDIPTAAPTTTEPTTPTPDATIETPASTTEIPIAFTEIPTEVPIATTATPTTDSPAVSTDEPTLTTDAPIVSTDGSTSTTGAPFDGSTSATDYPVVSTDGSTLTTDAPVVSTEVPVSTTEAPTASGTCTLMASAEDAGFGISVVTDPSCSSGGVGCIDEICRFCKVTTSLQSAPYVDCASLNGGSSSSVAPLVDATDAPTEVPTETPSTTAEAPPATADATNSPSEIPSETPSATTETPIATTETPVTTADTPDATSEAPTDTPSATTGMPTSDTPSATTEAPVTEPPAVTDTPVATTVTPGISTSAPVVTQETCGITAAAGDIAVGIYITTDASCNTGGIGCINDLCRFCKVLNTAQSAAFVDCSSIAGFTSDTSAPTAVATTAPGSTTSATCDLAASSGDAAVGIRIITDSSCSAGGVGCINDVCRFCKAITSVQSEAFIDCVAVNGYTPETEAPATTAPVVSSSSDTCTQVASDGDLAVGVDIVTDATCITGGAGCIDSVCRFCQFTSTPQSVGFVSCASVSAYIPRTAAPVDVPTSTPSVPNTNTPATQADCSLVVSAGDAAVGISITGDATCAAGGVGCIDSVCRFCKVATTVQSAAFIECASIAGFSLVSTVPTDTTTPPTAPATDNPATSTPVGICSLVVSEGDAAVGVDITADSTCQFGGIGCIDSTCRFCKVKTTNQSAAFVDCPAGTVAATSTPTPQASTTGNSVTSSSSGMDNDTDAPTEAPLVDTGASSTSDADDTTTPIPTEAPATDVDTSDLLTEAPVAATESPVSTIDIDDSGDWDGSDEGSDEDSDSIYFDSEDSLNDI
ncbi:hypothetical protein L914_11499 [Phytophthora nicotianae]|uniref:Uncharacterized protein n=1 Tax=Phytophthora nicotianae TaxID=4792 RepID=W2N2L0_PHYNI|nr:hypothetical protein L914_11499 [Phytophthora nicotianae]